MQKHYNTAFYKKDKKTIKNDLENNKKGWYICNRFQNK